MLRSVNELQGYTVRATDGEVGWLRDLYFDDQSWTVRYLVIETGNWLKGRQVLIPPGVTGAPKWEKQTLPVGITKTQVKSSPHIDADKPVSRRMEEELHAHYGWPPYWISTRALAAVDVIEEATETSGVGPANDRLGWIKGSTYFLDKALEEANPEVREALRILKRGVARCERTVNRLLSFARPTPPDRREVNVNQAVREALSATDVPKNVEVLSYLDPSLPSISADPDQLSLVFGNIILNAIQAMPEGGRLVVKSETSNQEWVSVSFTDTGVGIPEENPDKLFEPRFTTKAKGTGLGLAIVNTLVEEHGGSIGVESERGEGSVFTVCLPLRDDGRSS
jgi:two-component sensor histidine kinase